MRRSAMRRASRVLASLVLAAVAPLLAPAGAFASCALPASVADNVQRADAVVYGRVASFEGPPGGPPSRTAIVQVERVYKGTASAQIAVAIGPAAEGGGGAVAATSVDYPVTRGSDHTLYLMRRAPAGFETNACIGSHGGPPTAEEQGVLGQGRPPDRAAGGVGSASDSDRVLAGIATIAV